MYELDTGETTKFVSPEDVATLIFHKMKGTSVCVLTLLSQRQVLFCFKGTLVCSHNCGSYLGNHTWLWTKTLSKKVSSSELLTNLIPSRLTAGSKSNMLYGFFDGY